MCNTQLIELTQEEETLCGRCPDPIVNGEDEQDEGVEVAGQEDGGGDVIHIGSRNNLIIGRQKGEVGNANAHQANGAQDLGYIQVGPGNTSVDTAGGKKEKRQLSK